MREALRGVAPMSTIDDEVAVFVRERDEALASLDEKTIRAMCLKWGSGELPPDPERFWGTVHKAITAFKTLPIDFRRRSKAWLEERGFSSNDDGDL
jgi:hypothetical protein